MAAPFSRRVSSTCSSLRFRTGCLKPRLTRIIQLLVPKAGEYSTQSKEFNGAETHFGFQSVAEDEKENKVYEVFENVASKYDMMNDAMSGGVHRIWKDIFLERFAPSPGTKLLDVAGGTGDIAFRFLKYVDAPAHISTQQDFGIPKDAASRVLKKICRQRHHHLMMKVQRSSQNHRLDTPVLPDDDSSHVIVCDINQAMLDVGRQRAKQLGFTSGISWLQANAENLPLPDNLFDAYTIAFGIRNCTHVQKVLDEAYRLLKPGGRFLCLEFSEVKNPLLRSIYDSYSFQVIPVMGQLIAGDWKSYQYLVESIRQFPNQEDFAAMIRAAGFRMVSYENLTFGVTAIHSGFKI
ncbi:unnamed protein product [Candidula unifasciata]|uniref:2-methoxy-6-polyprenyl-1,4-benzoquinol methylase, mitochondrial n=1 Tax=Candidula unifasciata TaxID=100452 RepID=A0A8S3YZP2_9EUPU|nr:unnamed protein product [Candidula unifasciata]